MRDTIYRDDAIRVASGYCHPANVAKELAKLPSAQPQRDIPKKPNEATDRAWGIPRKQAVCPNCDYYLGMVHFLGEGKKKVTYCETCGQAIDWSEWEVEHDGR